MEDKDVLRYSPPIRGKIGTLYSGRFLWEDILLLLVFLLLPPSFRRKVRGFLEKKIKYELLEKNGVVDKEVFFFDSGTSALFLALKLGFCEAGRQVYFSPNTCEAVGEATVLAGGTPVFLDALSDGSTDFEKLSHVVERGHGGVLLLTNTYGLLEDLARAEEMARRFKLFVINDLAQANVLDQDFSRTCSASEVSVLSFGPEKYLAGPSGGAIIVDKKLLGKLREIIDSEMRIRETSMQDVVRTLCARARYYFTFYVMGTFLYNLLLRCRLVFKLNDTKNIDAFQLRKHLPIRFLSVVFCSGILRRIFTLRHRIKRERAIYDGLVDAISRKDFLVMPRDKAYASPFLIIRTAPGARNEVAKTLAGKGFQTTWNHVPLPMLKPFRGCRSAAVSDEWKRMLQIPFRTLTHRRMLQLANAINYAIQGS